MKLTIEVEIEEQQDPEAPEYVSRRITSVTVNGTPVKGNEANPGTRLAADTDFIVFHDPVACYDIAVSQNFYI